MSTVDGRPAPLLAVDSVVQGVAVPAGDTRSIFDTTIRPSVSAWPCHS
jgi:hypothetical protein